MSDTISNAFGFAIVGFLAFFFSWVIAAFPIGFAFGAIGYVVTVPESYMLAINALVAIPLTVKMTRAIMELV